MQLIQSPNTETFEHESLYLAGGITGTENWQKYVIDRLSSVQVTIFNPRRDDWDPNTSDAKEQIRWEIDHMRKADGILFWFPPETLCPIALFELGQYVERLDKWVTVGAHPEYARRFDVEFQVGTLRAIRVHNTLSDTIDETLRWINERRRTLL